MIYTLHTNNLLTVYSVDMQYDLSLSLASDDVLKCDMQALKVSWKLWFSSSREVIGGNQMEVLQVNHRHNWSKTLSSSDRPFWFCAFWKIGMTRARLLLVLMSLHFNTTSVRTYMALTMGQPLFSMVWHRWEPCLKALSIWEYVSTVFQCRRER